ncbi:hypothetical protein ACTFIZ_008595 [Dictyostelium cf. discoideum]
MKDEIKIKFVNIKSKNEFLLETYFKGFNELPKRDWEKALEYIVGVMENDHVVTKGDFEIDSKTDEITVISKERGISFGVSANTDKTSSTRFQLANPFGKGGLVGLEFNAGLYKNNNGSLSYTDRFGNTLSLSKSSQDPVIKERNFKIDETTFSYSFQRNSNKFSIFAGDSTISVLKKNKNKEHLANTGLAFKTGISHIYSNNFKSKSINRFFKIQNELAFPILSSCSFFKSNITYSLDFPLYEELKLRTDFVTGGIFNFSKNSMIPLSERFFNGRHYNLEGFVDSSLTEKGRSPYLGSSFFFTFRTALLHKIKDNASIMAYHCIGNTALPLDTNETTFKSTALKLFSPNSIRSSIGLGVSVDMGPADIECSLVKPLFFNSQDEINNFAFGINIKI